VQGSNIVDVMSDGEILRRDGYWPSSPVVGHRGAQTRRRIVAETLKLFEANGFHGTSVDSIAAAAGTSRATLYQYFASKEQIFVELLEECGAALTRVVRRLGPLGPTAEGFDNLHWWLGEWAWVYDKYATMFVQWASVDTPETAVRPLVIGFVQAYNDRLADRLVSSGVTGIDPGAASLALTSLVHRFNFFRHRGNVALPPLDEALDGLAVVMQLMLFPDTPAEAFAQLPGVEPVRVPLSVVEPADAPPSVRATQHLSPRATVTVGAILAAGARLFTERGFHGAGVDAIVAEAGFARATFYKYFEDKADLLMRLSEQAAVIARGLSDRLAAMDPVTDGEVALRAWFGDFLPFHRYYLGVFRTWVEGAVTDPEVYAVAERGNAAMHAAALRMLQQVERRYPLDLDVAAAVFLAMLDRLPEAVLERTEPVGDDKVIDLMMAVVRRGLLNDGASCT
jgi:AcrR family transcriptional regulator